MLSNQTRTDVRRITALVEALGYGDGLSEAHRILGTARYHEAFGPWEIEDRIVSRYLAEGGKAGIVVNHWTEKENGVWVAV